MLCPNCNEEISDQAEICPKCGVRVKQNVGVDKPNWGVNILALCCIPILGIIMFFVWKDEKPQAAKSALIFGLINIGLYILFYIAVFVLGIFGSISNSSY